MADLVIGSGYGKSKEKFRYTETENEEQIVITAKLVVDKTRARGQRLIARAEKKNKLILSEYLREIDLTRKWDAEDAEK